MNSLRIISAVLAIGFFSLNSTINACTAVKKQKSYTMSLSEAVQLGDFNACESLIQGGAEINAKNSSGMTPLCWAAKKGDARICLLLINNGADVHAKMREV